MAKQTNKITPPKLPKKGKYDIHLTVNATPDQLLTALINTPPKNSKILKK